LACIFGISPSVDFRLPPIAIRPRRGRESESSPVPTMVNGCELLAHATQPAS
jgi:hypothetical protein